MCCRPGTKRIAINFYNCALVIQAIKQRIDHIFGLQELIPFVRLKIRSDDCGLPGLVTFLHKLKESIHLFFVEGEVAELI